MAAELSNENHARLIWVLLSLLYSVVALRCWALRRVRYKLWSPRGISSICILATVFTTTILCAMVSWSLVGSLHTVAGDNIAALNQNTNSSAEMKLSGSSTVAASTATMQGSSVAMSATPTAPPPRIRRDSPATTAGAPAATETGAGTDAGAANAASIREQIRQQLIKAGGKSPTDAEIDAALGQSGITTQDLEKTNATDVGVEKVTIPWSNKDFAVVFKVNFASMAIFYLTIWLVKASFIVIYFEFAQDLGLKTRRLLYVSSCVIVISFIFVMLVHSLWCLPFKDNWDMTILTEPNTCRSELTPSILISTINVSTDLLLMCAGTSIIRSLNLGRSDLRAASLIILIGTLTILTALVRLSCLVAYQSHENDDLNTYLKSDPRLENQRSLLPVQESVYGYPEVEAILAAMATCFPALRVLFRHGKTKISSREKSLGTDRSFGQSSMGDTEIRGKEFV